MRLYVAGASYRSRQAILRARQLCEAELKDNCELEVIDVYQQPILARDGQIVATPTLVKEFPQPVRRLIGSLSDTARLFVELVIKDDGIGFEPDLSAAEQREQRGFGLVSMSERAAFLGGALRVKSAPRAGTEIVVRIPRPPTPGNR